MPIVHFLNVDDGDCSIIEHISGHTTVIDVCNATPATQASVAYEVKLRQLAANEKGTNGNFSQKSYPTNPVLYMLERDIKKVFRFILTHPDLDHMDGIESFFNTFTPTNFWDTANRDEKKDWNKGAHKYNESDWRFYKSLRDGKRQNAPTRLTLYSGAENQYFNTDGNGKPGGDGLYILAPTQRLWLPRMNVETTTTALT
jgi:beta-lactamase superfamily II metal-dependent hydrolase